MAVTRTQLPPGRVGARWLTLFSLAWLAVWTVQLTPVQLLLPLQLDTQDTEGEWIAGVVSSGVVLSVGGLAGVIAGPLAGALSDRTRSRFGRRRPWVVVGTLITATTLILTGAAQTPWTIGAAWVGVWIGLATTSAALTAMIADQLVVTQRGAASAVVSSAQAVGIVLGVGAIVLLGLGIFESYVVLAVLVLTLGLGSAVLLPDPPGGMTATADGSGGRPRRRAVRDATFVQMLAGRLIVNIGNALGTALLLFFLLYGIGVPAVTAEDDLLLLILIYTFFVVVSSIAAGSLSDRLGRRGPFVVAAALVQAFSAAVILLFPSFVGTAVAAAFMGAGYGAYMAVSLALCTDLLPDDADNARDLGIVNVSAHLGQLMGPLIGAGLVALVGGFWLLFAVAGVLSVIGAAMTPRARSAPRSPRPRRAGR
ncbi:MAG: MFS transporter [Actinomycetota bacterium]